jgi:hypothetical protein
VKWEVGISVRLPALPEDFSGSHLVEHKHTQKHTHACSITPEFNNVDANGFDPEQFHQNSMLTTNLPKNEHQYPPIIL